MSTIFPECPVCHNRSVRIDASDQGITDSYVSCHNCGMWGKMSRDAKITESTASMKARSDRKNNGNN